jgi:hypothetical protein
MSPFLIVNRTGGGKYIKEMLDQVQASVSLTGREC